MPFYWWGPGFASARIRTFIREESSDGRGAMFNAAFHKVY